MFSQINSLSLQICACLYSIPQFGVIFNNDYGKREFSCTLKTKASHVAGRGTVGVVKQTQLQSMILCCWSCRELVTKRSKRVTTKSLQLAGEAQETSAPQCLLGIRNV